MITSSRAIACLAPIAAVALAAVLSTPSVAQPAAWILVPELRIGGAEDERNNLSEIASISVGADGSIYIAEGMENAIHVFDARGSRVRTLGRKGDGPGEFQLLALVGFKGDTLWAYDDRHERLTFFRPDGRVATTLRAQEKRVEAPFSVVTPLIALSDGSVLGYPDLPTAVPVTRIPLFRMARVGGNPEVVAYLDWRDNSRGQVTRPNGAFFFTRPVSSESLWAVSSTGDAVFVVDRPLSRSADVSRFRVTRLNARGDTVFSRTYRYTPQALSREVRNRFEEAAKARPVLRRAGVDPEAVVRALALPNFLPPITEVVAGRDGTVWLKREAFEREQVDWMVLDARGEVIATLRLPAKLQVHQADRRNVWGVLPDEMDVPQVIRYRVSPAAAQGRR